MSIEAIRRMVESEVKNRMVGIEDKIRSEVIKELGSSSSIIILNEPSISTKSNFKPLLYWYKDKQYTISEIAKMSNLKRHTVCWRLANGWSVEDTMSTPTRIIGSKSKRIKSNVTVNISQQ